MTRIRRYTKVAVILLIAVIVTYLSRPDRGGLSRCGQLFEMPELKRLDLTSRPFLAWTPFESPKFRFEVSPTQFAEIDSALKAAGYSIWEKGGVTYGSVSHGWTTDEDYVYCSKKHGGHSYTWSYSARENLIFAILFP
jgi:hypothetical protein